MSESLRLRCEHFLSRTPPGDLGYVPGSMAERLLGLYVEGVALDEELLELLALCAADSRSTAEDLQGAARTYLLESARLLEEIAEEAGAAG